MAILVQGHEKDISVNYFEIDPWARENWSFYFFYVSFDGHLAQWNGTVLTIFVISLKLADLPFEEIIDKRRTIDRRTNVDHNSSPLVLPAVVSLKVRKRLLYILCMYLVSVLSIYSSRL